MPHKNCEIILNSFLNHINKKSDVEKQVIMEEIIKEQISIEIIKDIIDIIHQWLYSLQCHILKIFYHVNIEKRFSSFT